jgi:uncharacterized protein YdhG (YjbR/CyaY superfamily)
MENKAYISIDDYIAGFPIEIQKKLQELRAVIKAAAPEAEEKISYQMPAFAQNGILVYFAAHKNHIGFYPTSSGIEKFKDELSAYENSKGAIRFPIDEPIPYELVKKIVAFRLQENLNKVKIPKKTYQE